MTTTGDRGAAANETLAAAFNAADAAAIEVARVSERVLDAALETGTEFGNLIGMCIARTSQSLYAARILVSKGLNGDAMSAARTIVEFTIDLAYIATDPDQLLPKFVDYAHVRAYNLAEAVEELHGPENVNQDAMSELRRRRDKFIADNNTEHNWAGCGLRKRAERAGAVQLTQLYDLFYEDMCAASHSGYQTLKYALVGDPDAPRIHFGPQPPDPKPIELAFSSLIMLLDIAVSALKLAALEPEIEALNVHMVAAADALARLRATTQV